MSGVCSVGLVGKRGGGGPLSTTALSLPAIVVNFTTFSCKIIFLLQNCNLRTKREPDEDDSAACFVTRPA